jgi:hypothetical protein
MRDERTLTERVECIEKFLHNDLGLGDENSMCDRAVTGQRHVNEDKLERHIERATKSPEQTAFEEIINRIQSGTDRVCMIASKLEEIGNRVLGPIPENAEGAGGVAKISPDGTLDHTFIALNWLDQTLCRLHAAAARLERI